MMRDACGQKESSDNELLDENGDRTTSEDPVFFTTGDLIKTINGILKENEAAFNEKSGGDVADASSSVPLLSSSECGGGFELQRRLPDGTTRKADESDMALANFQSKIKQTADKISTLSPLEKINWAKEQRQYGNKLYSKQLYREAMDVYLTCLVAIDFKNSGIDKSGNMNNTSNTIGGVDGDYGSGGDGDNDNIKHDREGWSKRIDNEIKLPVLLNLSACTLKLGMHRKTCSFCDIALEMEIPGSAKGMSMFSKVYFRRGKSRMLMGLYSRARADFDKCLALMEGSSKENDSQRRNGIDTVKRELITLQRLAESARKNRERQEKAMKLLLGGGSDSAGGDEDGHCRETKSFRIEPFSTKSGKISLSRNNKVEGLYTDIHTPLSSKTIKSREYSTLRAKPRKRPCNNQEEEMLKEAASAPTPSYVSWYLQMVRSSLRKILYWLGDENIDNEENYDMVSPSLGYTKKKYL